MVASDDGLVVCGGDGGCDLVVVTMIDGGGVGSGRWSSLEKGKRSSSNNYSCNFWNRLIALEISDEEHVEKAIEMETLLMCCKWKVVDLTPCVDVAFGKSIEEVVAEMATIRFGILKNASTNDYKHSASLFIRCRAAVHVLLSADIAISKESGVPEIYWCERGENTALEALTGNIDGFLATILKNYSTNDNEPLKRKWLQVFLHTCILCSYHSVTIHIESVTPPNLGGSGMLNIRGRYFIDQ
ncbi:hypothetical protein Tco_0731600 [Tanacetum coccineum]